MGFPSTGVAPVNTGWDLHEAAHPRPSRTVRQTNKSEEHDRTCITFLSLCIAISVVLLWQHLPCDVFLRTHASPSKRASARFPCPSIL